MRTTIWQLLTLILLFGAGLASAHESAGFELEVLVDGRVRPEYSRGGTVYVEALRGRDYALRLTNPRPVRVAVALAVDGLNTIDAKHTDPREAAKWVMAPYGSVVISGWQVDQATARSFYFAGERDSYGAALGQTEDLGVIEAVFYAEQQRPIPWTQKLLPGGRDREDRRAERDGAAASRAPSEPELSDEYAATGMGEDLGHRVESVHLDLGRHPAARLRVRYEFREQLVELGVLRSRPPLERRESARGFASYCPEPDRGRRR